MYKLKHNTHERHLLEWFFSEARVEILQLFDIKLETPFIYLLKNCKSFYLCSTSENVYYIIMYITQFYNILFNNNVGFFFFIRV